jgi:hypothetical protein
MHYWSLQSWQQKTLHKYLQTGTLVPTDLGLKTTIVNSYTFLKFTVRVQTLVL